MTARVRGLELQLGHDLASRASDANSIVHRLPQMLHWKNSVPVACDWFKQLKISLKEFEMRFFTSSAASNHRQETLMRW
jgi:hypothetical protein